MTRLSRIALGLAAAAMGLSMMGASLPPSWDGMVNVPSSKLTAVYLLPGADFRPYAKVMIDPVQVAFQKNWIRDYNQTTSFDQQLTPQYADMILKKASNGFDKILHDAYVAAGYPVVTAPGPDVIRVSPGVGDLTVTAPDIPAAFASMSWAVDAGGATVVLEARDSMSHALLGRAVDSRRAGDNSAARRDSITNSADFERLFRDWAKVAVDGLAELKARSPINVAGETAKK